MDPMDGTLAGRRLASLGLDGLELPGPEAVVGHLLAVQSQDYGPAKWSLGQRSAPGALPAGPGDAGLDTAFAAGAFLRTHVLRPTWHFVLPADIRWLLALTGPRVHALNRFYYGQQGLDPATLATTTDLIAKALAGGAQRTRAELAATLAEAGIQASGVRLAYILMHAELEAVIASGALAGKQHTYALLDERAPAPGPAMERDQALAELARRYCAGRAPATAKDLAWWSSVTVTDARRGFEAAGLGHLEIDGQRHWFTPGGPGDPDLAPPRPASPSVHLLQAFDEYFVGYSGNERVVDAAGLVRRSPSGRTAFNHVLVIDTQVAGHWKRTLGRGGLHVDAALYRPLTPAEDAALLAAAAAQAGFLGAAGATVATFQL
jgi:hypothetical protein